MMKIVFSFACSSLSFALSAALLASPTLAQTNNAAQPNRVPQVERRPVPQPNPAGGSATASVGPSVVGAPTTPTGVSVTLQNAERSQNADALLLTYGEAVTDPTLSRAAIVTLLSNYYTLRNQAQTADQATQAVAEATLRFLVLQSAQNQVIIQQNQQLLEQNARLIQVMERNVRPAR